MIEQAYKYNGQTTIYVRKIYQHEKGSFIINEEYEEQLNSIMLPEIAQSARAEEDIDSGSEDTSGKNHLGEELKKQVTPDTSEEQNTNRGDIQTDSTMSELAREPMNAMNYTDARNYDKDSTEEEVMIEEYTSTEEGDNASNDTHD